MDKATFFKSAEQLSANPTTYEQNSRLEHQKLGHPEGSEINSSDDLSIPQITDSPRLHRYTTSSSVPPNRKRKHGISLLGTHLNYGHWKAHNAFANSTPEPTVEPLPPTIGAVLAYRNIVCDVSESTLYPIDTVTIIDDERRNASLSLRAARNRLQQNLQDISTMPLPHSMRRTIEEKDSSEKINAVKKVFPYYQHWIPPPEGKDKVEMDRAMVACLKGRPNDYFALPLEEKSKLLAQFIEQVVEPYCDRIGRLEEEEEVMSLSSSGSSYMESLEDELELQATTSSTEADTTTPLLTIHPPALKTNHSLPTPSPPSKPPHFKLHIPLSRRSSA